MSKKINVSELAETLYPDLDNLFSEDYKALTKEINETEDKEKQRALLYHAIQMSLKNHSERFTIELLQKVVDELNNNNSST